jgi:6-phosphofructokinase 1
MVAYRGTQMVSVPIADAIKERKLVPVHSDTIRTAREIGICPGD